MTQMPAYDTEIKARCGCTALSELGGAADFKWCPLHAAAPELLVALKKVLFLLKNHTEAANLIKGYSFVAREAEAAIVNAEGRA